MSATKTSVGVKRSNASSVTRLSMSLRGVGRVFKSQLWLWPILAAIFLAAIGWWVQFAIERSMQTHFETQLKTLLDVDVMALKTWLSVVEEHAVDRARDRVVRGGAIELADLAAMTEKDLDLKLRESPFYTSVQKSLAEKIGELGFDDFVLFDTQSRILVNGDNQLISQQMTGETKTYIEKVRDEGPLVSRPTKSLRVIKNRNGDLSSGVPVMFAGAPVLNAEKKPVAILTLRMRPEGKFSELLKEAQFGETGETYAFDDNGLMISQSRFDEDLKRVGILPESELETSVLNLELRDPGVNMMVGERPTLMRHEMPLTRMAQKAIDGTTGVEASGYPDYRGVPTIAAWTWLDRYNFGLATKVDYNEAFTPLFIVRRFIWFLIGLLAIGAGTIYVFMIVVARQTRELQRAALGAKKLGQYALEDKIGAGGMGTVYRARHQYLRRPTAVKLLDPEKVSDLAIARFEREVQLTSQLSHPNTIAIYDYGRTDEGLFYYVMELLEGMNLDDLVRVHGPQPEGRVSRILEQMCGSLAEAHAQGLAHRDIKPANVYLTVRGGVLDYVKVLDFGLAKDVSGSAAANTNVTAASSLTGTPLYLAPEVIEHPDKSDSRGDVYAIGAVAYYLLTGTPVFRSGTIMDLLQSHLKETPELPSQRLGRAIDADLERLVMRCLAKDPNDRPANGAEFLEALSQCEISVAWTGADARNWWNRTRPHFDETMAVPGTASMKLEQTMALGATRAE